MSYTLATEEESHDPNLEDPTAGTDPGGVELGTLAAEKGVNPQVKQLGAGIVDEQERELKTLERLVRDTKTRPIMPAAIAARDKADMMALKEPHRPCLVRARWFPHATRL